MVYGIAILKSYTNADLKENLPILLCSYKNNTLEFLILNIFELFKHEVCKFLQK